MKPIIFALGSTSPHKIAACKAAFESLDNWSGGDPELQLRPVAVASGVPPQPIGLEQTRRGALQRAEAALQEVPEARYAIGIESGIVRMGGYHSIDLDLAVVAVVTRSPENTPVVYTTSVGVPVPSKYVNASLAAQQQTEAGKFYAEEHGCDPTDFTSEVTRGVLSRVELTMQAVLAALSIADIRTEP